jgi:HTH-type transcriptional regulator/antitoxin HipB
MIVSDAKQLGLALATRRSELGLTQSDVADVIGVNRRVVGELERGKGSVRLEIALEIARALGLDLDLQVRER